MSIELKKAIENIYNKNGCDWKAVKVSLEKAFSSVQKNGFKDITVKEPSKLGSMSQSIKEAKVIKNLIESIQNATGKKVTLR